MAYTSTACFGPRVNFFSNPHVEFKDKPTGDEETNNALTIKENMVRYASIDPSSLEVWVAVSSVAVRRL